MEEKHVSPLSVERTLAPSDWQHAKILIGRNFRKDFQKPKLYFAKFLLLPILLMVYCIGFLISANGFTEEPANIQGDFVLFDGQDWTYPKQLRLGGFNDTFVGQLAESILRQFDVHDIDHVGIGLTNTTNRTVFLENCRSSIASSASDEICAFLDENNDYTIFYGGNEEASPYQLALSGAQWVINSALLELATGSTPTVLEESSFPVSEIQRAPEKVSQNDNDPITIVLLLPPIMHVLACAVAAQFLIGPISYEKINHVTESFLFVGVKMRIYLYQWIGYYSINLVVTAGLLTVVAEYWLLMPMSSNSLIFMSHFLGLVQMISSFTILVQFIEQEELAQSLPFLVGIINIGIGAVLLLYGFADSITMYIMSVLFPFIGMMQYYGIYITYDYTGFDTGILVGSNVVESGLLGSFIAQLLGIALYLTIIALYASEGFNNWVTGEKNLTITGAEGERNTDTGVRGDNFEPLAPTADVVIRVRGVEHTYRPGRFDCDKTKKTTSVLKGLDMDICRGEVFAYLGHNGAGKTTSINILADQLKLQQGSITYHFRDGEYNLADGKNTNKIRNKIGVCPQLNNTLQEDLSARETLRLFAHLKGGMAKEPGQSVSDAVEMEVERRLAEVKFTTADDCEKPIGTYSGGMKRKVLIAMALLGDPEIVFLDEPTAGLDPYNRRSIWDMIVEAKEGRSIILTTHFLDEADVLSDRVGIIRNGSLITCGSSLFLKHAFGVGYTLSFEASEPIDVKTLIQRAEPLIGVEKCGVFQWRLSHGTEAMFPRALNRLTSYGARNIQLELTTLEQVFLETGKEDIRGDDEEGSENSDDEPANSDQLDIENLAADSEALARIWEPRVKATSVGWWRKLFLVQHFMMINASKIKSTIFLNVTMPLIYLIAAIIVAIVSEPELEGEVIESDAINISPYLAGLEPTQFFGLPSVGDTNLIAPITPSDPPVVIEDYFWDGTLPILGGHYVSNSTLQYAADISPFALQIATAVISNFTAFLNTNGTLEGIATSVQQLSYTNEAPFRVDLLFIPYCIMFGFAGLAFSVLDVLLLKGNNIIGLFRVAGITEWTTYLGVMAYKFTTTFLPFFTLLVVLGCSVGLVIFGNAGRWLGTVLLMFAFAYSSTPMGLILAKRFIHSDFKSVSNWFPGVYFTLAGVPYIAYSSLLQALPEAESAILIFGDILCLIPQVAFQRGLGAVIAISTVQTDPDLTWGAVWSFRERVWFTILIMFVVGSLEWYYLYVLTTSRESKTRLSDEETNEWAKPIDISDDLDLVAERERSRTNDEGINARDIVKVFRVKDAKTKTDGVKVAVKGISFGVRKNEIFALLGPNGAGKSVTMSAFAGQTTPEHGEVALDGVVVKNDARGVDAMFKDCNVAYVPQFDALFSKQTVEQHLRFYARIRGLDWNDENTQNHVNAIVKVLALEKHRHKDADQLSGGYKRRLSLALALLGYPKAIVLDEVTTGLDPGARRLIWDVLKPKTNQRDWDVPAVLLSTHYMEESEALGDRIGIMIDGEFAATGSLNQLYDRYCTSFFVEISLLPSAGDNAEDVVLSAFEANGMDSSIYESLPYHMKLQVPFVDTKSREEQDHTRQLADIFAMLESEKESLMIKFYSVARMNLEQIFIDLSRKQFEIDNEFVNENRVESTRDL